MSVSIFDSAALTKHLNEVIPSTDDNAIILDVDAQGAKFAAHVVKTDHWSVNAVYEHDWSGENAYFGQVIFHWKS